MFVDFFHDLKSNGVPVSLREYLSLLEALDRDVINRDIQEFYYLSRAALVKDEKNLDKFDVVFGKTFKGLQALSETEIAEIPTEWLQSLWDPRRPRRSHARIVVKTLIWIRSRSLLTAIPKSF